VRIYLATVVLALLRIARAWHAAHSLVGYSRETFQHRAELADLSSRFRVKLPQLRESEEVSSPMVVGVATPVVLLPEGFSRFTEDQVRAALCHELAHVKRQDYLMNLVCQVVASPLAWHPEFKKQMENAILNDADFQRKMAMRKSKWPRPPKFLRALSSDSGSTR
jgi:beta-lactamase regulating signal transducer with metallopeptidase domain